MFVDKLWGSETIDYDSKIYNFYVQKQYSEVSNEKPNDDDRQTTKFINFIEIIKKQRNPTYVNALYERPLKHFRAFARRYLPTVTFYFLR